MDKHVTLITGASKGMGLATASLLAKDGHYVIGLARSECKDFPGQYVQVDLSDPLASEQVLAKLMAEHKIDGLFNNVGIVNPNPLEKITVQELQQTYDVNCRIALQCTQAVVPAMKAKKYGRIVNNASLTVAGVPFRTSYAAAKSALVSFTRSWALELAPYGITVNTVSPGPTNTHIFRTNNPPGSESYERYKNMVPMKKIAEPVEVGYLVAFLLNEKSSFITGQNIFVDGGATIGKAPV